MPTLTWLLIVGPIRDSNDHHSGLGKNNRKNQPSFSCRHSNAIPSYQKASSTKKNIWIKAGGQSQQGFGSFFFSGLVCSTNIRSAEIIIIFIITKMSQIFLVLFPITSNRISKYFFIYFLLNTFLIILWTWCAFKIHNSPILFFLIYIYIRVYIYVYWKNTVQNRSKV